MHIKIIDFYTYIYIIHKQYIYNIYLLKFLKARTVKRTLLSKYPKSYRACSKDEITVAAKLSDCLTVSSIVVPVTVKLFAVSSLNV